MELLILLAAVTASTGSPSKPLMPVRFFAVRAQVISTCVIGNAAVRCTGAARRPPRVSIAGGYAIYEF